MQLSPNFSLAELTKSQTAARRGIDNTPTAEHLNNLRAVCAHILEPVRRAFGAPVRVSSAYRGPKLNAAIRGSKTSQHMTGQAADFEIIGVSNVRLATWIRDNLDFDQLILEFVTPGDENSGWVHCSYTGRGHRKQVLTAQRRGTRTVYLQGLVI